MLIPVKLCYTLTYIKLVYAVSLDDRMNSRSNYHKGGEKASRKCPYCHSRIFVNCGTRRTKNGSIQRYRCKECDRRFSESTVLSMDLNNSGKRQVCEFLTEGSKNLAKVEPLKSGLAGATSTAEVKGIVFEFGFWLKKQGYKESTIETRMKHLEILVKRGADLRDAESVKEVLALQEKWCDGTKANYVDTYTRFLEKEGLVWRPPIYKRVHKLPFIPSEAELDQLIAASGNKLGTFLQTLKETGADPGEVGGITWADINKETKTITINSPVKGHNSRILKVSAELIKRLETLPENNPRIFKVSTLYRNFYYRREVTARKLQNPRLLQVKFTTFRHWKATREYHRTKDILYVQKLLGHKSIQNTLIYIDLEKALFNNTDDDFTVRVAANSGEACQLAEVGFEYVTGEYNDGGKIFRKHK